MKIYRCQHCKYTVSVQPGDRSNGVAARVKMGRHYDTTHKILLPPDMDGYRWFYFLLTGKSEGSCVICHQPTQFNRNSMKYTRFCDNPACKQVYKKQVDQRMMSSHGKLTLLNDPDHQKKMQMARRIAGIYNWSDNKTKIPYLSSLPNLTGRHPTSLLRLRILTIMNMQANNTSICQMHSSPV